jgi:hypothetical protein
VLAVQIGVDVLHDVDVFPALASATRLNKKKCADADLLSRISLISFTSVFMFVEGEICETFHILEIQ